jgi:hypothetical protein
LAAASAPTAVVTLRSLRRTPGRERDGAQAYFTASAFTGEPAAPVIGKGAAESMNS